MRSLLLDAGQEIDVVIKLNIAVLDHQDSRAIDASLVPQGRLDAIVRVNIPVDVVALEWSPANFVVATRSCSGFDARVSFLAHFHEFGLVESLIVAIAGFVVAFLNSRRGGARGCSFGVLFAVVSLLFARFATSVGRSSLRVV